MLAQKTPFLTDDALEKMVVKHQFIAINLIIKGDVSKMNPSIKDASCQSRTPILLDANAKLLSHLKKNDKLDEALRLATQFEAAHAKDTPDTKVKSVEDAEGGQHPAAYDAFFEEVRKVLGDQLLKSVGLCYTHTVPVTRSFDEFGLQTSIRNPDIYRTSTRQAVEQNNLKFLKDRTPDLRCAPAKGATNYMSDLAWQMASDDLRKAYPDTLKSWGRFEDQVAAALQHMTSFIPIQNGEDIPLQCCFMQSLVSLWSDFQKGRAINVCVTRIEITTPRQEPQESPTEEMEQFKTPSESAEFDYKLSEIRCMQWVPDEAKGTFEFKKELTEEEMVEPCTTYTVWSSYVKDTNGVRLKSANNQDYFAALEESDITWLLLTDLACHPPFTGYAKDKSPDLNPLFQTICNTQTATFRSGRERCEAFTFKKHTEDEIRPSLERIWALARLAGMDQSLNMATYVTVVPMADGEPFVKRNHRAIDFKVAHISVETQRELEGQREKRSALLAANSEAIFGRYIVRMSRFGVSCSGIHDAKVLSVLKREAQKATLYKKLYPKNVAFLPPSHIIKNAKLVHAHV